MCRGVKMGSRWWRFMDEQWLCDVGECVRLKVLLLLHCYESPYLAAGLCWMVCAGGVLVSRCLRAHPRDVERRKRETSGNDSYKSEQIRSSFTANWVRVLLNGLGALLSFLLK